SKQVSKVDFAENFGELQSSIQSNSPKSNHQRKKLTQVSQNLSDANFLLLKKNLDLILQKKANEQPHEILKLISRSSGNDEFQRYFLNFIKQTDLTEFRSIKVFEALIAQVQDHSDLLDQILVY